jgi:phasin family protein
VANENETIAPKPAEAGKAAEARATEVKRQAEELTQAAAARVRKIVDNSAVETQRVTEKTMEQANRTAETLFKAAEDAAEFSRGNVEAFAKAAQAYVAGMQDLGRFGMAIVQGMTDHALEGAKALTSVKSLQEAAQVQANYTRSAIEKAVSESARFQEAALKVAEQSFAPLSARMTLAVEKFSRQNAA